jgi:arabinofuranosyltransferase
VWRRITYGLWVPNTYYAKHVAPWPQAGLPYVGSFLIEYGLWVWVLLAVAVATRFLWRARSGSLDVAALARLVGIVALLGHVAYYVLLIGGDHFEFRIFQHLVPLALVTLPWLADALGVRPWRVVLLLACTIAIGLPIPWLHFRDTRDLDYEAASKLRYRVSPHFPAWLRWYSKPWDRMQGFVTRRFVGLRHQTHKTFLLEQKTRFPSREEGLRLPTEGWPVFHHISVGWPGWVMPTIPIIDEFGLSDRVAATMAPRRADPYERYMAHDRKTPDGYVECFDPNVTVRDRKVTIRPRDVPLTEERIVECERTFLAYAREHANDPPSLPDEVLERRAREKAAKEAKAKETTEPPPP